MNTLLAVADLYATIAALVLPFLLGPRLKRRRRHDCGHVAPGGDYLCEKSAGHGGDHGSGGRGWCHYARGDA